MASGAQNDCWAAALTAGCLCLQEPRAPSSSMHLRQGKSRPAPAPRRALLNGSVGRPPLWTSSSRIPLQSLSGYVCATFDASLYMTLLIMYCFLRFPCSCVHQNASISQMYAFFFATFGVHNLCLCMFWITLAHQSSFNVQYEVVR